MKYLSIQMESRSEESGRQHTLIIKLMEYIFIFIAIEIIVGFFVLMYIIKKN